MTTIVIGLDPGSGVTSPTGFFAFDPHAREVIHVEALGSNKKTPIGRLREIRNNVWELLSSIDPELEAHVFIESFLIRGKSGETLARLTGALMSAVPEHMEQGFVQNTTAKRIVGGHGAADKSDVAKGVAHWFSDPSLCNESFDITDAAAIGIAGWERHIGKAK